MNVKLRKIKWKACAMIEDLRLAEAVMFKCGMKHRTNIKIEDGDTWVTYVN